MKHLLAMETWKTVLLLGPLGVVLLIAAWTDLRERKVYNKLTYPAILIGLLLHTITLGLDGFLSGLLAASLMLVIGLFLIVTPAIKGGDIKLLMVVGAFAGGKALLEVSFYAVFAGLRYMIISIQIGLRAIAYGQMEQPSDLDELLMNRSVVERMMSGEYWD